MFLFEWVIIFKLLVSWALSSHNYWQIQFIASE